VLGKKNAIVVFITMVMVIFGGGALIAQSKIAYVDSQKILSTFSGAIDAQKKLDEENATWDQELKKMNDDYKVLQEQLEQQSLLLSEAKKKEKAQELQAAAVEIQQYQNKKWGQSGDFFKRRGELMQPVIDQINRIVHQIGEDEDYDFIFDTVAGNIIHAKERYDITESVLEELEKETPPTTTTPQRRN